MHYPTGIRSYARTALADDDEPESYAASAYDACRATLNAIERAGTKDRAAVTRELLATRDHDGLLGRWSFDANGDITLRRTSRLTVEGGDFAFLAHFDLPR